MTKLRVQSRNKTSFQSIMIKSAVIVYFESDFHLSVTRFYFISLKLVFKMRESFLNWVKVVNKRNTLFSIEVWSDFET